MPRIKKGAALSKIRKRGSTKRSAADSVLQSSSMLVSGNGCNNSSITGTGRIPVSLGSLEGIPAAVSAEANDAVETGSCSSTRTADSDRIEFKVDSLARDRRQQCQSLVFRHFSSSSSGSIYKFGFNCNDNNNNERIDIDAIATGSTSDDCRKNSSASAGSNLECQMSLNTRRTSTTANMPAAPHNQLNNQSSVAKSIMHCSTVLPASSPANMKNVTQSAVSTLSPAESKSLGTDYIVILDDDEDYVDPSCVKRKAWVCPDCTFINEEDVNTCDVCGSMVFSYSLDTDHSNVQSKDDPSVKSKRILDCEDRNDNLDGKRLRLDSKSSNYGSVSSTNNIPQTPSPQNEPGWNCPLCTFFNHPDLTICECCQTYDGSSANAGNLASQDSALAAGVAPAPTPLTESGARTGYSSGVNNSTFTTAAKAFINRVTPAHGSEAASLTGQTDLLPAVTCVCSILPVALFQRSVATDPAAADGISSNSTSASVTVAGTKQDSMEIGTCPAQRQISHQDTIAVEEPGWNCKRCTFENHPVAPACECCMLERYPEVSVAAEDNQLCKRLPPTWLIPLPNTPCQKIVLDVADPEYIEVAQNAQKSAKNIIKEIVQIHRIENPTLYELFCVRRDHMVMTNGLLENVERQLWHGTTSDTVDKICNRGFNRSYCGRNATTFGRGVYFARDFWYSAHDCYSPPGRLKIKYVFQCRVLTGRFAHGRTEYVEPPVMDKKTMVLYDAVVDSVKNPSVFVVFHDAQVYPEYLVSFRARHSLW